MLMLSPTLIIFFFGVRLKKPCIRLSFAQLTSVVLKRSLDVKNFLRTQSLCEVAYEVRKFLLGGNELGGAGVIQIGQMVVVLACFVRLEQLLSSLSLQHRHLRNQELLFDAFAIVA